MVKKKSVRQKHQADASIMDTSEEEIKEAKFQGKVCQHVARGLNFTKVKRSLKAINITSCGSCENAEADQDDAPEVWLCLQCGNRGCGRMSSNKHALQHFKTIHSDCHALVLSTLTGTVWCYECDDGVEIQQSKNLRQSVEFLNKLKANKNNTILDMPKSSAKNNQSYLNIAPSEEVTTKNVETKFSDSMSVNKNKKENPLPKLAPKGLRNLGNTCFFNAVMQNLNQTYLLHQVLERLSAPNYEWEIPHLSLYDGIVIENTSEEILKVPLLRQFPLATSLLNFYKLMNTHTAIKNEIVNPNGLFTEISKKCPQFKHFQEQDSHELLRQLLDGLRQDEVKRQKKAILRHFDIANIAIEEVDEDTKKLIKSYGCYASHTIVEKIFGGLFISTVLCEECKMSSQVFEPFMDISLPLFEEKQQDNCSQPYLDGGQLQDIKPLRNRKINEDLDDNNEYVLNKSKKDYGKPSKHQLRKMKDLARKEKKKKNLKGRKLSEVTDESAQCCENANEDKDIVENAEDDTESIENTTTEKNMENEEFVDERNQNCSEVVDNVKPELQQAVTAPECDEENISKSNLKDLPIENSNYGVESGVDHLNEPLVTQIEHNKNVDSVEMGVEKCPNANEFNKIFDKMADTDSLINSSDLVKDDSAELSNSSLQTMANELDESYVFSCILEDLLVDEIPDETEYLFENLQDVIVQNEDVPASTPSPTSTASSYLAESLPEEKCNGDLTQDFDEEDLNSTIDHSINEVPSIDQSMESLTQEFENIKVSSVNDLKSEERMQALGLQVKGVRIRKDSDRQGSILDSSHSPDDESNIASGDSREDTCDNDEEENWSCSFSNHQIKEWILKSLQTLKPRLHISPNECSVDSCLTFFTKPELLTGSNKFRCENCTEIKIKKTGNAKDVAYSNASKQLLIFSPPAILTLHLKRFQQVNMSLRKVNRFVEFPLILDLAPYCSSACLILPHLASVKEDILYSLYGVVEHSGRLSSGHYTAYVKTTKKTLNEDFMCHIPLAQCDLEQLFQKFSKSSSEKTSDPKQFHSSENRRWYFVSDAHVREVDESQVLKCQAYLLFYERIK